MNKVYAYEERHPLGWILLGIVSLFSFVLFFVGRAAMGPAPLFMTITMNVFVIILPVIGGVCLLFPFVFYPVLATREIVFSEEGITFRRGFRPITIQKITGLKIRKFRGRENSLTITGLTPDGRQVRKTLARVGAGDVGRKWEEFKQDIQEFESGD